MKTVAIIGGGVIGGGWLARFVLNGWSARVFDPAPDARQKIDAVLENARRALPMLYETSLPPGGDVIYCDTLEEALVGADWVQESVPERLDLKLSVYAAIEASGYDGIIGSSTSGYKPSELQEGLTHPGRLLVAHPFNPVYLLPLVEVVPSPATPEAVLGDAMEILSGIGMHPLHVRQEIDAHIADRLLEAVWREALWLVKDDVATTAEIDDAIRYGFGLRWAQMGLFETYRIAGGEAGMAHFIAQFGPCLEWPWTKLTNVPELTPELIEKISSQSDEQSGDLSIRALERLRDDNLVAMLRALKGQGAAAGALIAAHEAGLSKPHSEGDLIRTVERIIPVDWTDYNGHMNESRYGQVFSDAADSVLAKFGAGEAYVASGLSYFTVDINIQFKLETHAGQHVYVETQVLEARGKKLRLFHHMRALDGGLLATGEQLLIHVDLGSRRACEPGEALLGRLQKLEQLHANLPDPREER